MAKCPKCRKEVSEPEKSFKNSSFHIEAYTCNECNCNFKVMNWNDGWKDGWNDGWNDSTANEKRFARSL